MKGVITVLATLLVALPAAAQIGPDPERNISYAPHICTRNPYGMVNVRREPSIWSDIVARVHNGTTVYLYDSNSDRDGFQWWQVEFGHGPYEQWGWVRADYVCGD